MALQFDGSGYVALAAAWAPTNPLNFELEVEFQIPTNGGFGVTQTLLGETFPKGGITVTDGSYHFRYEGAGSTQESKALSTPVNYGVKVKIRTKVVSSTSVEVYFNDEITPSETLTLTSAIANSTVRSIGFRKTTVPWLLPTGAIVYSAKLTDLDSAANSSVYLLDESIGTTASDSGALGNNGTLIDFADPNSAWIGESTPTITNIDTDNAVNQYQQAVVNVSDFTETITSVTLGGVACTVPENDPTDNQITVGVPGSLTTGTYDLVISGATETDTLTGVSYTQTHARPAFDGLVDSNSILNGQSYTPDTYFRFVTSFSNGTLDLAAGDAAEWAGDIADYYTPNAGFTGDDTGSIEFLYSDGTTSAAVTVTITVPDTLSPAIDSVTVPTAGTYIAGQALQFTVNWNEVVNVTGTPAMNFQLGGSPRQANYVSGTGTAALVFSYTVQSGDEDADGIVVSSLTLDGGTIEDGAGNPAYLTLNSIGDTSGVLVDGVSPVISINPLTTLDTSPIVSGSAGDATSLTLVVTGVGTYNPVPSGGSWSQQLPTLALGDYPMTLNGQDSAGNPATEASATLSVVEEIVSVDGGLFRPLFRSQGRGLFRNLFR